MSQKIKSFLSFVVIFVSLAVFCFIGDAFQTPKAKAGSTTIIGWNDQPVMVQSPSHATFWGKIIDMGSETSIECGYDYSYDFGQSEPNVRKSNTMVMTSPGIFPVDILDLIPNMHYCVTARCGGGGYSSSQYCFDTPAATSDSQKVTGPVPLTYPPGTISANSIGGKGRVEGILSYETINYWFTFRSPTFEYKNTEHKTISGSALLGSGNFVTDMMNGLMPSTGYLYRVEVEKGGNTYSGNWETAMTSAGQPPVTEFYYCPDASNGCSLTSAGGVYTGTSEADCNAALKAKFGNNTSKICYVPERKAECDGKCSANFNSLMSYCDKYGSPCSDTTAFNSLSACNKYVQDTFPGTGRMCYTFENKQQCNITCGAGGSNSGSGNYYYCPESGSTCSIMPAWYNNVNDCNEALKFRFGSNTTRRCFDAGLQSSCNSNCQSINGTTPNNGGGGGSVGPTLYIYYFCPQGKTTCTAMPKGYANKTLCNEALKVIFKDASRICYEYKDRDACNTACSKAVGKYYNYCMTDTGKCFRTLYPQKDALTCKNYVLGRFGKNTTGWCYENLTDCTNNCKVAGTAPVVKPTPQTGSKLYYCVSGKKRCDATAKFYTSKTACKSYIEQAFPGQTTGKCYVSAEDCAEDCINAVAPAPDTSDDVSSDTNLSSFDWRNKDKKNWMTPVKSQGGCGGCWAFAGTGVAEALYNIENKMTDISLDLSEQDIISCSGQGNCGNGGTEEGALTALKAGVVTEQCFPYSSANWSAGFASQNIPSDPEPVCSKCSNSSQETWKIGQYRKLETGNPEEIKKAIVEKGPLLTAMWAGGSVNENGQIINYNTNFFEPIVTCSPDPKTVNHAVVVVGYNDKEKYWIVRNSWGMNFPTYGAGGYFKLGYDQCNIFQEGAYYAQDVLSP